MEHIEYSQNIENSLAGLNLHTAPFYMMTSCAGYPLCEDVTVINVLLTKSSPTSSPASGPLRVPMNRFVKPYFSLRKEVERARSSEFILKKKK